MGDHTSGLGCTLKGSKQAKESGNQKPLQGEAQIKIPASGPCQAGRYLNMICALCWHSLPPDETEDRAVDQESDNLASSYGLIVTLDKTPPF